MIESSPFVGNFNIRYLSPFLNNHIVVFIVADWHWIVDNVSDSVDQLIDKL